LLMWRARLTAFGDPRAVFQLDVKVRAVEAYGDFGDFQTTDSPAALDVTYYRRGWLLVDGDRWKIGLSFLPLIEQFPHIQTDILSIFLDRARDCITHTGLVPGEF